MRIYHVYNPDTGEIYYSAPDLRACQEMRDAAKAARYKDVTWQIGSTIADENGCIDGSPWYDVLSYEIQWEKEKKLGAVSGPYRDEIIKQRAVEKNVRILRSDRKNDGRGARRVSTDYSEFGV